MKIDEKDRVHRQSQGSRHDRGVDDRPMHREDSGFKSW